MIDDTLGLRRLEDDTRRRLELFSTLCAGRTPRVGEALPGALEQMTDDRRLRGQTERDQRKPSGQHAGSGACDGETERDIARVRVLRHVPLHAVERSAHASSS